MISLTSQEPSYKNLYQIAIDTDSIIYIKDLTEQNCKHIHSLISSELGFINKIL